MNAPGTQEPPVPEPGVPPPQDRRTPTRVLEVALVLALVIGAALGAFVVREIHRLRDEQTAIADRNRKGSLQLLRVQNDLASLASLMRDMVAGTEPYPMAGWRPAFERVRADLAEALDLERALAPAAREASQQARIERTVAAYWATVDRAFALAAAGDEAAGAALVRGTATQQHMELSGIVSQFLVANNRVQEEAVAANRAIFDQVARQIILLVVALLVVFAAAGGLIVAANRRAFEDVRRVTAQLRALSWRSLRFQEDLQRSVSRELHDDFGQIVTALGTMIGRARRHAGAESALVAEIDAVRHVAQEALDRIRTRSQWLHPGVLDDFGLEKALARAAEQFERQTGIRTRFTSSGPVDLVRDEYAIHVYRIAQEALANVGRHSGSTDAVVRLRCKDDGLALEIEDHGRGLPARAAEPMLNGGMGLVSMRERAELMGGHLTLRRPADGGLVVDLRVPGWKRPAKAETVAVS